MKKRLCTLVVIGVLFLSQVSTSLAAGWQQTGTNWLWVKDDGSKVTNGWQQSKTGNWYYFDANGNMCTGFLDLAGSRYYLEEDASQGVQGKMSTGWKSVGGNWYFFNPQSATVDMPAPSGAMLTGWQWIDGRCYYFIPIADNSYGVMLKGMTTPDGYQIDEDGAWIENGKVVYIAGKGIITAAGPAGGGSSNSGNIDSNDDPDWEGDEDNYPGSNLENYYNDFVNGNTGAMSASQIKEVDAVINGFKNMYITEGMSDFEKEIQIIRFMVENCKYEKENDWSRATAYSSLVLGKAQCAGYADGFLKMANACGLEARYISNNTHAWNQVKIDENWYHIDVTFEDPSGNSVYGFSKLRNAYINLEDAEIRQAYAHRTWNANAYSCQSFAYGPTVVADYLKNGNVDISPGNSFEERCLERIKKYENSSGDNHFTIASAADGKLKVYNYLKSCIDRKADRFSYVIDYPKTYNAVKVGSFSQINDIANEIDVYVQQRLKDEYTDILKSLPHTKLYAYKYGDGTYAGVKDGFLNYTDGQGKMLEYSIRYEDKTGTEIQTFSGLIEVGKSIMVDIPENYKFNRIISGISDTVHLSNEYGKQLRLSVDKSETEKKEIVVSLLSKDDLTENIYSVNYRIHDRSESTQVTLKLGSVKVEYDHGCTIAIPDGYVIDYITQDENATITVEGNTIYLDQVKENVTIYIYVVTDLYSQENTYTYTLQYFTRNKGENTIVKTIAGTKLKYSSETIHIKEQIPEGYRYNGTGVKKSMEESAKNAYGSGWNLSDDRNDIIITSMVEHIKGYILVEADIDKEMVLNETSTSNAQQAELLPN